MILSQGDGGSERDGGGDDGDSGSGGGDESYDLGDRCRLGTGDDNDEEDVCSSDGVAGSDGSGGGDVGGGVGGG